MQSSADADILLNDVETDIAVKVVMTPNSASNPSTPGGSGTTGRPNVSVTKASTHIIAADNRISYTLTATNSGRATAYGLRVKDYVPQHTRFSSVDRLGTYGVSDGKESVSWFIGSLAPGKSVTMTFTVTVDDGLPEATVITNTGRYEVTGSTAETVYPKDPSKTTNTVTDDAESALKGSAAAKLTKVDANDRSTVLSGARFQLFYTPAKGAPQLLGTYTTKLDGTITVSGLPAGDYYWVEIGPPAGYQLDASKHPVTLKDSAVSATVVTNTRLDILQ